MTRNLGVVSRPEALAYAGRDVLVEAVKPPVQEAAAEQPSKLSPGSAKSTETARPNGGRRKLSSAVLRKERSPAKAFDTTGTSAQVSAGKGSRAADQGRASAL